MRLKTLTVIFTVLALDSVKGACDFDIITKINSLWGDNAPSGVLLGLIGQLTYLYIPHVLKGDVPGLKCIKTVLEGETDQTAIDYHLYEGDAKVIRYLMSENPVNITRSFMEDSLADDYVFPVYVKNGVFGFWQCRDDYESFINIGVLNYQSRKEEQYVQDAIGEAEAQLGLLGLEFPPRSPDC